MKEKEKNKYTGSDKYVVIGIEVVLVIMLLLSLWNDYFREREGGPLASVTRGKESMTALFNFMTGIAMFIYTLVVQLSEALKGHKVLIFVLNSIALIYLFFLSSYFRNTIFFPLLDRIMTD
jgi:hypothetical protein